MSNKLGRDNIVNLSLNSMLKMHVFNLTLKFQKTKYIINRRNMVKKVFLEKFQILTKDKVAVKNDHLRK